MKYWIMVLIMGLCFGTAYAIENASTDWTVIAHEGDECACDDAEDGDAEPSEGRGRRN